MLLNQPKDDAKQESRWKENWFFQIEDKSGSWIWITRAKVYDGRPRRKENGEWAEILIMFEYEDEKEVKNVLKRLMISATLKFYVGKVIEIYELDCPEVVEFIGKDKSGLKNSVIVVLKTADIYYHTKNNTAYTSGKN